MSEIGENGLAAELELKQKEARLEDAPHASRSAVQNAAHAATLFVGWRRHHR